MTASQLFSSIADTTGVDKKTVKLVLDTLGELAPAIAKREGACPIPGLGKLARVQRAARDGRNPATGQSIRIPAKTVAKFKLAKPVKDAIAGPTRGR